jgi:hypothetical protein
MFTLGSLVQALAPDTVILVPGRLIVGAGVGVAAVAGPLYAAELAPTALRGRFVSAYQLAITIGIFVAYLVDGCLSQSGAWRFMLRASAVPGLLLFAVALIAPKSPRWLMKMNRRGDAAAALRKIRPGVDFKARLDAIEIALHAEGGRSSWDEVFHRQMARSADDRDRARRLSADHRHQHDHLLCRTDLWRRRLCHAIIKDDGDHLGDRRRQRVRHPDPHRLQPSGTAEAPARRADRHGAQLGRGRYRVPVHRNSRCWRDGGAERRGKAAAPPILRRPTRSRPGCGRS